MEIRYKIYELVKTNIEQRNENLYPIDRFFLEASTIATWSWGFDTFEEAAEAIRNNGNKDDNYTILPYVYMP